MLLLPLCGVLATAACDEGEGDGRLGGAAADGNAGGKADDNDEDSDSDSDSDADDDESILDLIKKWKHAWDDTKELLHECVEAFNNGDSVNHFIEKGACSLPPEEHFTRFSHFVDRTWFEETEDGRRGMFTSVQDFYIERPDLEPEEVLDLFNADWDVWWDSLGTNPDTTGYAIDWDDAIDGGDDCDAEPLPDECLWHQEIAPIGISQVNIFMAVDDAPLVIPGDVFRGVRHPELDVPTNDPRVFRDEFGTLVRGHQRHWDAGLRIEMGEEGNAFHGTMVVLATKNEAENRIDVREIWYRTAAVSPLVMRVLPFFVDLTDEQLLSVPPMLHLLATQGCVPGLAPNSGYTGLFQKLESGEMLPPEDG